MFITSFLIGIIFIPNVNSNSIQESNIKYDFEKNTLFDDFDSLEKNNINLRHNNIITQDFNASYSFENEIGFVGTDISFIDVDDDDITTVLNSIHSHNSVIEYDNDNAWEVIFHNINDESYGSIEFWIRINQVDIASIIRIRDGVVDSSINLEFRETGLLAYYDGSYHTILNEYNSNQWYHFRIDFQCGVGIGYMGLNSQWKLYINNIEYGNYDFHIAGGNPIAMDDFEIIANINSIIMFDAIGFSRLDNYTIGLNKYPIIETIDSNILTPDKYEFNFNSSGNPYEWGVDNVFGWNSIYSSKLFIGVPNYTSNKSENINGLYIKGYNSGVGIQNQSLDISNEKINITFGLEFAQIESEALNTYILFYVYSLNDTEIIRLKLDIITTTIFDLQYYDGGGYQDLVRIYGILTPSKFKFNLYLENYEVKLSWFKDYIYNDTYIFPLIVNELGVNIIKILNFDNLADANDLLIRLSYIGIYHYNISLTKEFSCLRYNLEKDWIFNQYNLFNFYSNNLFKIIAVNHYTIYPLDYYLFRDFDNQNRFINLHGQHVVDGGLTIEKPHLYLISKTSINLTDYLFFSIEGIKLNKYIDNVFDCEKIIKFYYNDYVNRNYSYYYVDNNNRLNYRLTFDNNNSLEYMMLYFDFFSGISSNNMSIHFKCREISLSIGKPYIAMTYYQPPDNLFYLKTYMTIINLLLYEGKEFRRFHFVITDENNNNFTSFTSEGYLYELQFNYIPKGFIPLDFALLGLIGIMIPLIILIVPTIGIYSVYRKKEIIIPVFLLMTIICFSSGLIPFELFFIMLISLGSGIFLQQKYKKEV